jgi:hypothetical protein
MMSNKTVLITSITGRDGSYFAELPWSKGYEVHGMVRCVAMEAPEYGLPYVKPIFDRITHAGFLESHATVSVDADSARVDPGPQASYLRSCALSP